MNGRALFGLMMVGGAAAAWMYSRPASASVGGVSDSPFVPDLGEFNTGFDTSDFWGADPIGPDPLDRSSDSLGFGYSLILFPAEDMMTNWKKELTSGRGMPYAAAFAAAEKTHAMPRDMIARLAWQESRYRPDIIDGMVKSSAGALGIMQLVPKWHTSVNPLDPFAAISYAAGYLAAQKKRFGSWSYALMAYNWGPTSVSKWLKSGGAVPVETTNYQKQILSDIGFSGVVA